MRIGNLSPSAAIGQTESLTLDHGVERQFSSLQILPGYKVQG